LFRQSDFSFSVFLWFNRSFAIEPPTFPDWCLAKNVLSTEAWQSSNWINALCSYQTTAIARR